METRLPLEMATTACFFVKGAATARPLWVGTLATTGAAKAATAVVEVITAHAIADSWLEFRQQAVAMAEMAKSSQGMR